MLLFSSSKLFGASFYNLLLPLPITESFFEQTQNHLPLDRANLPSSCIKKSSLEAWFQVFVSTQRAIVNWWCKYSFTSSQPYRHLEKETKNLFTCLPQENINNESQPFMVLRYVFFKFLQSPKQIKLQATDYHNLMNQYESGNHGEPSLPSWLSCLYHGGNVRCLISDWILVDVLFTWRSSSANNLTSCLLVIEMWGKDQLNPLQYMFSERTVRCNKDSLITHWQAYKQCCHNWDFII